MLQSFQAQDLLGIFRLYYQSLHQPYNKTQRVTKILRLVFHNYLLDNHKFINHSLPVKIQRAIPLRSKLLNLSSKKRLQCLLDVANFIHYFGLKDFFPKKRNICKTKTKIFLQLLFSHSDQMDVVKKAS